MDYTKVSPNKFMVESESGDRLYNVRLIGDKRGIITCDCNGYRFRRECKHVDLIKSVLASKGKKVKKQALPEDIFTYRRPFIKSIDAKLTKYEEERLCRK